MYHADLVSTVVRSTVLAQLSLLLSVSLVIACRHAPAHTAAPVVGCSGPSAIVKGRCELPPVADCHGVCGYVVRRDTCKPIKHATVIARVGTDEQAAGTDDNGRFELVEIPKGHHSLRVRADRDEGTFELDVDDGPRSLAFPLELARLERTCACGGRCVQAN